MSDLDDLYLPATEILAAFKSKDLSPVEFMTATIERAGQVEDKINAFTYRYYDEALDAAKVAESKYMSGAEVGPLEGLPIGIKDESYIAGKPTSNGSLIMQDFIPDKTSEVNRRILAAGGIVHARTATPEFSCWAATWSRMWGVTRNPWNLEKTPGGSSGGSAASLASGTSALCTGSDIGGSIRIPASACGLVGYKPPYGRNPEDSPFNLDFYSHTGPLARSVKDAITIQNVMCGPYSGDIASLKPKLTLPDQFPPITGWKIAFSPDPGSFAAEEDVQKNTLAALTVFRDLGAEITEIDLGWGPEIQEATFAHLTHIFGGHISTLFDDHNDKMTSYCRGLAEEAPKSTGQEFCHSLKVVGEMYETLGPLLEDYNLLICPTNGVAAVEADHDVSEEKMLIDGKEVDPALGWVMTTPFNAMSRCPVLTLPSGFTSYGVPTGIQLVGRTYCDADVFQAALAYESAVGGWFNSEERRPRNLSN